MREGRPVDSVNAVTFYGKSAAVTVIWILDTLLETSLSARCFKNVTQDATRICSSSLNSFCVASFSHNNEMSTRLHKDNNVHSVINSYKNDCFVIFCWPRLPKGRCLRMVVSVGAVCAL